MSNPFSPAGTTQLSVTNTTGSVRLKVGNPPSARLVNFGAATIYWRAGDENVVATTADTPMPAGDIEVFDVTSSAGGKPCTHIAAITAASTATLSITCGQGI